MNNMIDLVEKIQEGLFLDAVELIVMRTEGRPARHELLGLGQAKILQLPQKLAELMQD